MRKIFTTLLALTAMASASAYDVTVTLYQRSGVAGDVSLGDNLGTMKNDLTYDENTGYWTIHDLFGYKDANLTFRFREQAVKLDEVDTYAIFANYDSYENGSIIYKNNNFKFGIAMIPNLDPEEYEWEYDEDVENPIFKAATPFVEPDGTTHKMHWASGRSIWEKANPDGMSDNSYKYSYGVKEDDKMKTVYLQGECLAGHWIGNNSGDSFLKGHYAGNFPFTIVFNLTEDGEEGPEIPDEPVIPPYEETPVNQHFLSLLEGQMNGMYSANKEFESDEEVDLADVDTKIAEIWDSWKLMNEVFVAKGQEETLPSKLMIWGPKFSYTIPQELEGYYDDYDPNKYAGPDAKMEYRWGYREGTPDKISQPYPLMILMHGSGDVVSEQTAIGTVAPNSVDGDGLYIVPRIPNGIGNYYRWYHQSKQWVWEKIFRQAMMRDDIDHDRIYFYGISEGAYGSQMLASFYADYLGGAGPMAGGVPLKDAPCENLRNTYFRIVTGSEDTDYGRNLLTQSVGEYLDRLQELDPEGYDHEVKIDQGLDHTGIGTAGEYQKMSPKLVKKERGVNPTIVRWENFPLDGRYRTGFYNLHEIESPVAETPSRASDTPARAYYMMDIDKSKNLVNLRAYTVNYNDKKYWTGYGSTITLESERDLTPATTGKIRVYLNNDLVDLSKPVTVKCNGQEVYNDTPKATVANMVNSCAEFYDPARVYPASVDVEIPSESVADEMDHTTSIDAIIASEGADVPAEYYTLQGVRVDNPTAPGIYICRRGNVCEKILVK